VGRVRVTTAETGGKKNADGGKDSVYILTITQHWKVGDDVTR